MKTFMLPRAIGIAVAVTLAVQPIAGARTETTTVSPACTTPRLVVWLDTRGNGAAGSVYYHLAFTNLSDHACTLRGFPGVSAVGLAGQRLGGPASRRSQRWQPVKLSTGDTAFALLRVVEAGNFPRSRCRPVRAAGLRVYPPNAAVSKIVPFPLRGCADPGVTLLMVGPVTATAA